MEENKDLFIAWNGSKSQKAQKFAKDLYSLLKRKKLCDAYLYEIDSAISSFEQTYKIAFHSKLFLLVADEEIPLTDEGELEVRNSNGDVRHLYNEMNYFLKNTNHSIAGSARVLYLGEDKKADDLIKIHTIFLNQEHFLLKNESEKDFATIINWIQKHISLDEKNADNQSTSYSQELATPSENDDLLSTNKNLDWNLERAKTWHKMQAPSKPSQSELLIYEKFFEKLHNKKSSFNKCKALILGSTIEFRVLASKQKFEVTVVDYSKSYYEEISKDLPENYNKEDEKLVVCNWCDMSDHDELKLNKYDIIIGDLAIGNIVPENIDSFFKNIRSLLSDDGYFLGKSIYKYSDYHIDKAGIDKRITEMINRSDITNDNLYEHIMYPLSIYACEEDKKDKRVSKINFQALYHTISERINERTPLEVREKFNIYLDEITKFDSKMPKDFYVYSYDFILEKLSDHNLYFDDVIYSKDVYKDDFPLLIVKGCKTELFNKNISILMQELGDMFIEVKKSIGKKNRKNKRVKLTKQSCHSIWQNSISAQYFLYQISEYMNSKDLINYIKKLFSSAQIYIEDNLDYKLLKIPEDCMDQETIRHSANTQLHSDLQKDLQFNYTCGIVANIINHCKIQQNYNASVLNLILATLFANREDRRLWQPDKWLWLSARICICLFPIYKQWKESDNRDEQINNYISKIEEVVKILAACGIEETNYFWDSEDKEHFDTTSLCLEVLFLYSCYINNIGKPIEQILKHFVRKNHIKESFVKYPIFGSLIDAVIDGEKINGKYAYKKLSGRIEWYTIIYKICKEWKPEYKDDKELIEACNYIEHQLKKFWTLFVKKAGMLLQKTIFLEKNCIPQILFSLYRTNIDF